MNKKKEFLNRIVKKNTFLFIDYINELQTKLTEEKKFNTNKNYEAFKKSIIKFKDYYNYQNIKFSQINENFINEYENFLYSKNISYNTICSRLSIFKTIINSGINEGIISSENNPFKYLKSKRLKNNKIYLNGAEINQLINYKTNNRLVDLYRDMFIFSCFCGGLLSRELIKLKSKDFDGTYLEINISNHKRKIKVPNIGTKIIEKYKESDKYYLFPVRTNLQIENTLESVNYINNIVRKMNASIQKTAFNAGIEKSITFKCSRHTFATQALIKGIPVEILQKLMGHQNIRETVIYSKIINQKIDEAMELI